MSTLKPSREQKPFTVFSSIGVAVVWSVTLAGAAIRYMKKTQRKPHYVMPGALVN